MRSWTSTAVVASRMEKARKAPILTTPHPVCLPVVSVLRLWSGHAKGGVLPAAAVCAQRDPLIAPAPLYDSAAADSLDWDNLDDQHAAQARTKQRQGNGTGEAWRRLQESEDRMEEQQQQQHGQQDQPFMLATPQTSQQEQRHQQRRQQQQQQHGNTDHTCGRSTAYGKAPPRPDLPPPVISPKQQHPKVQSTAIPPLQHAKPGHVRLLGRRPHGTVSQTLHPQNQQQDMQQQQHGQGQQLSQQERKPQPGQRQVKHHHHHHHHQQQQQQQGQQQQQVVVQGRRPQRQIWEQPVLHGKSGPLIGLLPSYVPMEVPRGPDAGPEEAKPAGAMPSKWPAPPIAPEDPGALLTVLQEMPQPRRRLVIFKSGGYVMSDLEELIMSSGLDHIMRVTNLFRKAHCALAKERWENGRRVDLRQHMQGAVKRRLPFLLIKGHQLDLLAVLRLVRPLLIQKGIVRGKHGDRKVKERGPGGRVAGADEADEADDWDDGSSDQDQG